MRRSGDGNERPLSVIAAWALLTGLLEVVAAITPRAAMAHAGPLGLAGVASVIFGALLLGLADRLQRAGRELPEGDVAGQAGRGRGWLHARR